MIEDTLRRFARQDIPPSRLETREVLAEARLRTRRRTRFAAVVAGAAAVLATLGAVVVVRAVAAGPFTPAGAGCVAGELDSPAGADGPVAAQGIDPSGRYVIGVTGSRDAPRAVLWTDGAAALLPVAFTPEAVNAAGLVVGFTGPDRHTAEQQQRPVVYSAAGLVSLPLPDGAVGGVAYAVNVHGDVLGTAVRAGRSYVSVRWRTTGTAAIVRTVAGTTGLGLTDDGVAVGFTMDSPQAVRWAADGATTALPVPRGAESATAGAAAGDWAVGTAQLPSTGGKDDLTAQAAARWNLRTGSVELIRGIGGLRVSTSGTIAGLTNTSVPALWRNGHLYTLPEPPGAATDFGGSLSGITADGHTLVGGVTLRNVAVATSGPVGDPVVDPRTAPVIWRGC